MMKKILTIAAFLTTAMFFVTGCSSTPATGPFSFALKSEVKENNKNLLFLKLGMTPDDVFKTLGTPDASEGFDWGVVWIYRTGMAHSVTFKGALDENFTPVVFDANGKLVGWGRQVYIQKNEGAQK